MTMPGPLPPKKACFLSLFQLDRPQVDCGRYRDYPGSFCLRSPSGKSLHLPRPGCHQHLRQVPSGPRRDLWVVRIVCWPVVVLHITCTIFSGMRTSGRVPRNMPRSNDLGDHDLRRVRCVPRTGRSGLRHFPPG